nr:glycosyltransferase family 39 protein [Actinomycetota bacterium]
MKAPAAWALLAALVAVSAALRFVAGLAVPGPWITPDETLYGLLGRDLWERGSLSVLGGSVPYYSLVYPLLVGLPLQLGDLEVGYRVLQALQALAMSATAIPVYLWGRTVMARGWALTAATLTVAIPGLAYSGLLMTEVAFYPAMTLAAWAAARAFERPALARQALLVGAVGLAVATRLQAIVLLPALLSAALPLRAI